MKIRKLRTEKFYNIGPRTEVPAGDKHASLLQILQVVHRTTNFVSQPGLIFSEDGRENNQSH